MGEVIPVKSEQTSHTQAQEISMEDPHAHTANHIVVDTNEDHSVSMYEENYHEYENYEEGTDAAYDGSMMSAANADANKAAEELVLSLMEKTIDENSLSAWRCAMCF